MIESLQNPKVKSWAELQSKKGREKHRAYLIEGVRLVEEAIASNAPIEAIIWQADKKFPFLNSLPTYIEQWQVTEAIIKKLGTTEQSQGILAVVSIAEPKLWEKQLTGNLFLLVDGVQDPGNLGTIIRSADAAGVDAIFLGDGTVDLYNPKTVRSTMGSLYHLPIYTLSLDVAIAMLKEQGVMIYASSLDTDVSYNQLSYPDKVAIIVGNEGNGISKEILDVADFKVKIPIYGKAESLNVAIATSLLLYEARRG